jgi:hypothetical protein
LEEGSKALTDLLDIKVGMIAIDETVKTITLPWEMLAKRF